LAPQVIAEKNGAEILRLWAASSDFTEDLRIGDDIIKANVEAYRRLRNTIRFMLANLSGFNEKERITPDKMQELEVYMLARLAELNEIVRKAYENFDFGLVNSTLFNFCTNDLSAFYFDIRKDSLYCDARNEPRRAGARTVMDYIFRCIVTWYAPILCFTMEEAWTTRFGADQSVHLNDFFAVPDFWKSPALIEKWKRIRAFRRVVTGAVEIERAAKTVGSSLEAFPTAFMNLDEWQELDKFPAQDIAITSHFATEALSKAPPGAFSLPEVPNVFVVVEKAPGKKCARCWRVLEETRADTHLCNRCTDAVASFESA